MTLELLKVVLESGGIAEAPGAPGAASEASGAGSGARRGCAGASAGCWGTPGGGFGSSWSRTPPFKSARIVVRQGAPSWGPKPTRVGPSCSSLRAPTPYNRSFLDVLGAPCKDPSSPGQALLGAPYWSEALRDVFRILRGSAFSR